MKRTIKILVLCLCVMLFTLALVSCSCSNGGNGCTHDWNGGSITKNPTCIAEGTKTYTCKICSSTYTESVAKLEHTTSFKDALDGTHNVTCSYCTYNEYIEHTPIDEGTAFEASCTEAAYTLHTCKDCGGSYKSYVDGSVALGHTWGDWKTVTPATCSAKGETAHFCTVCEESESIVIDENPDLHIFGTATVLTNATCVTEGEKLFLCTLCGHEKTEAIPVTTQHTWSETEADGTGWVTEECSAENCDASRKFYDASTLVNADVTINDLPDDDVQLGLQNATIQLPSDVVSQIKGSEGEKVEISAGTADKSTIDTSNMSDEEKARLENVDVYDFGISIGGESIGNFNSQVTVTIPYSLGENEDSEGIVIWYVQNDGTIEVVEATYDETSETVTFSVSHFSYYAVAYKESQAMKCKRGVHDMEATDITVAATCYNYGYTVYKCKCCLATELGNFVNRLDHSFGPFQDAEITCEEGGYKFRVCENEGCGYTQTAEYVRAKGHTISTVPTCTDGVYCEECNQLIKTPLGHDYTPWVIEKNPTEYEDGLKSRTCRRCENKETITIAAGTGVSAAHLESYQDFFEFLLRELVGSNSGTVSVSYDIAGVKMDSKITLNITDTDFIAYIENTGTQVVNHPSYGVYTSSIVANIYYDNGLCYSQMVEGGSEENGDNGFEEISKTDINSAFANMTEGLSFEQFFNAMEKGFEQANAMVEEYSAMIKQVIGAIPEKLAGDIPKLYNAIETTYAYLALRLGFDTNIKMSETLEVPSAKDVIESFGELLTKSESNGETVYTFDIQNIISMIKETLNTIKSHENSTLGEFLYFCYADTIKTIYPNATSFESFMEAISNDFTGETTVGQAFVKLASYLLKLDITIDEIYDAFDAVMGQIVPPSEQPPEGASFHDMLAQYANMTLDQLIPMLGELEMPPMGGGYPDDDEYGDIFGDDYGSESDKEYGDIFDDDYGSESDKEYGDIGLGGNELPPVDPDFDIEIGKDETSGKPLSDKVYDYFDDAEPEFEGESMTMSAIWAQVNAMLSQMTLGQVTIPMNGSEMSLMEGITMVEQMLDSVKIDLTASVTVKADGTVKLASLSGDLKMVSVNPENPEQTAEEQLGTIQMSYDQTNVSITLPDALKAAASKNIEYHFDANGNLIISGASENTSVKLEGFAEIPLDGILTKDEELSKTLGIDVYYTTSQSKEYAYNYVKVNGKYYSFNYESNENFISGIKEATVDKSQLLSEIIANPSIALPNENTAAIGEYLDEYDIYHTTLGFVCKMDGEWYILSGFDPDNYTSHGSTSTASGVYEEYITLNIYDHVDEIPFDDVVSDLKFYILKSNDYYYSHAIRVYLFGGELEDRVREITLATQNPSYPYIHCYGYFDNDQIRLLSYKPIRSTYSNSESYIVLDEDITDFITSNSFEFSETTYSSMKAYLNGQLIKNPTLGTAYEIRTELSLYYKVSDGFINFNNLGVFSNVKINPEAEQITLPDGNILYVTYVDGNDYYGFASIGGNYYAQAVAVCFGDEIDHYEYRNLEKYKYVYNYGGGSLNSLDTIAQLDKYLTKNGTSITISKDFFANLESLLTGRHGINLKVSETIIDLQYMLASSYEFHIPYISSSEVDMFGNGNAPDKDFDWYEKFDEVRSYDFNIAANNDGTVSIYHNGKKLELRCDIYSGLKLDMIADTNSSLTEVYGTTIYQVEESIRHGASYVMIGSKLYHYSTQDNYSVTYAPQSASYAIKKWIFHDLRYMATADYDGTELDVYEAEVFCVLNDSYFNMTCYVAFANGSLKVLGGCEVIGDNAVKFESLVKPNEYFPSLIPILPTANQLSWYDDGYINGSTTVKTIYYGYIEYYEPSTICGEGDSYAGRTQIFATKNGNTVSFLSSLKNLGISLILGSQIQLSEINANGYTKTGDHTSVYYNGTFAFAEFTKIEKQLDNYFKLAGKFYEMDDYYWNYCTYTKEEFIEYFYDKTFLYGVVSEDGSIILYTGDEFSSDAILYEGELRYEDADKVIEMDANFIDGYDKVYQYIFYTVPEDSLVVDIDGTEVYISESGSAYAKVNDNKYISGIAISNEDESYEFDPYYFNEAHVDSDELDKLLSKFVTLTEDNLLILSKDFAEFIKDCKGEVHVGEDLEGDLNYYIDSINIEDLLMYFDLANEK